VARGLCALAYMFRTLTLNPFKYNRCLRLVGLYAATILNTARFQVPKTMNMSNAVPEYVVFLRSPVNYEVCYIICKLLNSSVEEKNTSTLFKTKVVNTFSIKFKRIPLSHRSEMCAQKWLCEFLISIVKTVLILKVSQSVYQSLSLLSRKMYL
jgi:hypothetical protein